jgi:hypothetical protein
VRAAAWPADLDGDRAVELPERDDGALDVPAGPAAADHAVPRGLARALDAPQQRIQRVALAGTLRVAAALGGQRGHGGAVVAALVAELPGARLARARDVEVEVLGAGLEGVGRRDRVGRPAADELGDRARDLVDDLGDAHVGVGRQDPERLHVGAEQLHLLGGEVAPVDARGRGALEQRVVDVGDVLHVRDVVAAVEPDALERVEREVGGRVAEVGRVVRRDAADVEAHAAVARALGGADGSGARVEQGRDGRLPRDGGDGGAGPGAHDQAAIAPVPSSTRSTTPRATR